MPNSATYYVSPISGSNILNFSLDVSNIAAQQGGGTGLIYVAVQDNLEGSGIVGDPLKTKNDVAFVNVSASNNITVTNTVSASTVTAKSITGSLKGNGSQVTDITASNITNFVTDVEGQFAAGANLSYTTGTFALNNTISLSAVTASFSGNGSQVTNITASNITNFTADTRLQLSGSQYVTYNNGTGVISLPYTGSILGTTPLVLGQTATNITGLNSINATSITGSLLGNRLVLSPSGVQTISNTTTAIAPTGPFHRITLNSNITLSTAIAQIVWPGAVSGDILLVYNVPTSAGDLTLNRGATTKLALAGATVKLSQGGIVSFIYDGTNWVEFGVIAGTSAP